MVESVNQELFLRVECLATDNRCPEFQVKPRQPASCMFRSAVLIKKRRAQDVPVSLTLPMNRLASIGDQYASVVSFVGTPSNARHVSPARNPVEVLRNAAPAG